MPCFQCRRHHGFNSLHWSNASHDFVQALSGVHKCFIKQVFITIPSACTPASPLVLPTLLASNSERLCNGTMSVRLSVCVYVPSIERISDVRLVSRRSDASDRYRSMPPERVAWRGQRQCCDPRRIDAETHTQTYTLITVLRSAIGGGVTIVSVAAWIAATSVSTVLK